MSAKAKLARDAYAFSLGGVAAINSYAIVPAIADDRINSLWRNSHALENQPDTAREIEDFLARYFAPGCCKAA